MKLAETTGVIERSGDFQESTFRIAASAKAFEILSSKLYSDIPCAIVRELSTNAYDAHVEVGNTDKPFNVHLPSFLEPWFEIRDFGPGLSEEDVKDVYTVYFESTRNKSNEFAGCLGVGSKSPFAYTDSFMVSSYVNGEVFVYSLFKNEAGLPTHALLSRGSTTEPNGVAIKIGVARDDINKFCTVAANVYQYFNIKPNITGGTINYPVNKPMIKGNNYEIYRKDWSDNHGDINVVMGQVCYKTSKIELRNFGIHENVRRVIIYANIGDCSVTASRETLHMDEMTIAYVKEQLKNITEDVQAKMLLEMNAAATTLEKLVIQNKYLDTFTRLKGTVSLESKVPSKYDIKRMFINKSRRGRTRLTISNDNYLGLHNISYVDDLVILENDTGKTEFDRKTRNKISHWINQHDNASKIGIVVIQDHVAFNKDFGAIKHKVSTLPDPPKTSIPTFEMERNKSCIRKFVRNSNGHWQNVSDFDEQDNAAIVLRENNSIIFNKKKYTIADITRVMRYANINVIYGLPARLYKKYDGDLEDLFEIAEEMLDERIANLNEYEINSIMEERRSCNVDYDLVKLLVNEDKVIKDYIKFVDAESNFGDWGAVAEMVVFFSKNLVAKNNFRGMLLEKYPLFNSLGYVSNAERDVVVNELKAYIKGKAK